MNRDQFNSALDVATRTGAIAAGFIYVSGTLVVSIHHAQFGITDFSLLKPRFFSAGLLFLTMIALPVMAALRTFGLFGFTRERGVKLVENRKNRIWINLAIGSNFYWACYPFVYFASMILYRDTSAVEFFTGLNGYFFLGLIVLFGIIAGLIDYDQRPAISSIMASLTALYWFFVTFHFWPDRLFHLNLWFFLMGIGSVYLYSLMAYPDQLRKREWERALLLTVVPISFFATSIYGNIDPSLGGGRPAAVTVYFEDPTTNPISPSKTTEVYLVDETPAGFYVVKTISAKDSFFLRRDLVTAIHLGKRAAQDNP